jgi:hypothetical protein
MDRSWSVPARKAGWAALLLWTLAYATPQASAAIAVPAATSSVDCTSNNPEFGESNSGGCALPGGNGLASAVLSPFVNISTEVSAAPAVASLFASGDINYFFAVVGGTAGDSVPVLVHAGLDVDATLSGTASASIVVTTNFGSPAVAEVCAGTSCTEEGDFGGVLAVLAESGQFNTISLTAVSEEAFSLGGRAGASADPLITIDPSFADAAEYSIVVSPGVANALPPAMAVPEPSTWAMMLLGFAGLSLAGYRANRKSVSIAA